MLLLPSPCPLHLPAEFLAIHTCQPVIRHFQGNFLFLSASVSQSEVFLLPVSKAASAGSTSEVQGPDPKPGPLSQNILWMGPPSLHVEQDPQVILIYPKV